MQHALETKAKEFLGASSWAKYLGLLALLIGAGFLSSGVVTWLAANWAGFSKFQKLYGTQVVFALTLLLSLVFYWYQKRRLQSQSYALPSAVMAFIGAVLIGALFALIGQTYQTGADLWQLFALWSVLQIPLLLALPNVASFSLFMLTSHVGMTLFANDSSLSAIGASTTGFMHIGLALVFLVLSELCLPHLRDRQWRISPKLAAIGVAASILLSIMFTGYEYDMGYSLLGLSLGALGMYFYRHWRFDLGIFVLSMLMTVFSLLYLIISRSPMSDFGMYFIALLLLIMGIAGVIYGFSAWRQRVLQGQAQGEDIPWLLQVFFLILVMVASLIFILLLGLSAGLERLYLPGLLLMLMGLGLKYRHFLAGQRGSELSGRAQVVEGAKVADSVASSGAGESTNERHKSLTSEPVAAVKTNGLIVNLLAQAFVALGLAMLFVDTVFLSMDGFSVFGALIGMQGDELSFGVPLNVLLFTLLCVAIFFLVKAAWLRIFAVVLFSWAFFSLVLPPLYAEYILGYSYADLNSGLRSDQEVFRQLMFVRSLWLLLVPICVFLAYRYPQLGRRRRTLFWALSLYALGSFVFEYARFSMFSAFGVGWSEFNGVVSERSLWSYLGGELFVNPSLYSLPLYLTVISPTIIAWFVGRSLPFVPRLLSSLVVLFISILWSGNTPVLFALALLLVAYHMHSYLLFALALVAGMGFLALHYFSMLIPLIYKSYILLISGLILFALLALWYVWMERRQVAAQTVLGHTATLSPKAYYLPISLIALSLVIVLGLSNFKIAEYEHILDDGEPVILELAPVDPRSLMQGDYMELRFAIADDIREATPRTYNEGAASYNNVPSWSKGFALLRKDERGVAQLCRVSEHVPEDFGACTPGILMPYKSHASWPYVSLPSEQYFFAEGAEPYYAQARFGEFKVTKDGVALLVGLRDKDLQPMQAPADMQKWLQEQRDTQLNSAEDSLNEIERAQREAELPTAVDPSTDSAVDPSTDSAVDPSEESALSPGVDSALDTIDAPTIDSTDTSAINAADIPASTPAPPALNVPPVVDEVSPVPPLTEPVAPQSRDEEDVQKAEQAVIETVQKAEQAAMEAQRAAKEALIKP